MNAKSRSRRRRRSRRPSLAAIGLIAIVAALVLGGCRACAGVVNPSPGLRWFLFSNFGAQRICPEMLKQGVGLRTADNGPMIGRFFPTQCSVDVDNANQLVTVNFTGTGYAYTPATRRVGFQATASVQYMADFYIGEDDLYVWGKVHRIVNGPNFNLGYVENPVVSVAAQTPLGIVANLFGNQIVAGELTRGFTVLQNMDTDTKTFALGIINPPAKPRTPYDVSEDEIYTFANETVEVQHNQRDFLGPFEVVEGDQQLFLKAYLQGPAIEALVVSRQVGDAWRESYQLGHPLGPPPGPVMGGGALQPNAEVRLGFSLPPGQYYVVLDNTATAGNVAPPAQLPLNPLGGPVARVSYAAQLVD